MEVVSPKRQRSDSDLAEHTDTDLAHDDKRARTDDVNDVPVVVPSSPDVLDIKTQLASHVTLETLDLNCDEAEDVKTMFYDSDPNRVARITSIERITNPVLENHYTLFKSSIEKYNQRDANEKLLFHGTDVKNLAHIINDGFDIRRSRFNGVGGVGLYFSKFPDTASGYVSGCPADAMKMLFCRVILGESTTLSELRASFPLASSNHPIRHPQPRSATDSKPFDSVSGYLKHDPNQPMHIVYQNYQALPLYVITYSVDVEADRKAEPVVIPPTHPHYVEYIRQHTTLYMPMIKATLAYEGNKEKPDYPFFEQLRRLFEEDPMDTGSIHQVEKYDLKRLRNEVNLFRRIGNTAAHVFLLGDQLTPASTKTTTETKENKGNKED